jgi:leader peptidase (prepilin peptidase)/N-methyltransferase
VTAPLAVQAALFVTLLLAASASDIRGRIIPDSFCAAIALTGLIAFSPVRLFGILAALPLLIAAMSAPGGIGGGDVKLTAASGLVLGFAGGTAGLILGLAAFLVFHLGDRIVRRKKAATSLPMAPFLSVGFITAYALMFR